MLQDDGGGIIGALFGGVWAICWLAFVVLIIAGFWKTFEKAGQPGWAAIIPIYNLYVLCLIAGRPGWWVLLYFIPFVNIIVSLLIAIDVAKAFGKDTLYGVVLLWLFQAIGYLLLGFGDAQYIGPSKA
ncbi:MAG: hypothetical protein KF770_06570 [Anaerolineae bacterium]|nr:hypothetical protein [Anaerolineae bacterium]